jgi:hypothetical protein
VKILNLAGARAHVEDQTYTDQHESIESAAHACVGLP